MHFVERNSSKFDYNITNRVSGVLIWQQLLLDGSSPPTDLHRQATMSWYHILATAARINFDMYFSIWLIGIRYSEKAIAAVCFSHLSSEGGSFHDYIVT